MKRIALFLLLLPLSAAPLLSADVTIRIGDTPLTIPAPAGFVPVTKEMAVDRLMESLVAPQNTRFVSFIPEEFLPAVQRGELPAISRNLSVQTTKPTVAGTFTAADFAELKKVMREQSAELMKKVEKEMPGYTDQVSRNLKSQLNADVAMKLGGLVPFPPHEESDRSMSLSMLVRGSVNDATGRSVNGAGYVTTTFLFARAKLFFIYVNGGEPDLEWTRQISKEWAAAILAANPSDAETSARESAPASRRFDWFRVWRGALIGGAVGGLYGLIRVLTRKKNQG